MKKGGKLPRPGTTELGSELGSGRDSSFFSIFLGSAALTAPEPGLLNSRTTSQ